MVNHDAYDHQELAIYFLQVLVHHPKEKTTPHVLTMIIVIIAFNS